MAAAAGGDFPSAVADATVRNKHHGQLHMVSDSSNLLAYHGVCTAQVVGCIMLLLQLNALASKKC
jgi:hypothetical protein